MGFYPWLFMKRYLICLRYHICSAWFLDIRISTCFIEYGIGPIYLGHILVTVESCRSYVPLNEQWLCYNWLCLYD